MSYPNGGGYNAAQMGYAGGTQPNYPGAQQGGYGAHPAGGYASGGHPGSQLGGHPGHPHGQGGGYANHGGDIPSVTPEVQQWFNAVDRDHSGKISAKELQAALVNGQGRNFSDRTCSLMIGMFDHDKTGTIDVYEFQQLYNYINQWIATFRSYDRDNSGHIEEAELTQAFQQMGFRFSPEFIKFLIMRNDQPSNLKIAVDQFIVLCVQIQRFTGFGDEFHAHADQSNFDKRVRKRKRRSLKKEDEEGGNDDDERDDSDELIVLSESGMPTVENRESKMEIVRLKAELNQLITENVQLIQENRNLHEENHRLEQKAARLEKENIRFQEEHKAALELTSWLNSAKDIVQSLKERVEPVVMACSEPSLENDMAGHDHTWNETETVIIKQEKMDDMLTQEEEPPYHTPLLNFDQVDLPAKSVWDGIRPDNDAEGREQLLHPDPVDGVCELYPGSRIFVSASAMDNIQNRRTHSSVARGCLEGIFKMSVLLTCSVQGNVAKGPFGKPEFQRPSLYKPAVECILKYARIYAERNGWKIEENTTIKKQMNTRLSELRNMAKIRGTHPPPPTQTDNT